MSRTLNLRASASVTLDGSGNGTASIGPSVPGEVWYPTSTSVLCTGTLPATGSPTLFLYAGNGVSNSGFLDSTYNVINASSSMISGQMLYPGQQVFAVWSDGPAGGTASLVVVGTRSVP